MAYVVTYMWNPNYGTNELIYKTEADRQGEQTCGCQGRLWVGEEKIGSSRLADANYYI